MFEKLLTLIEKYNEVDNLYFSREHFRTAEEREEFNFYLEELYCKLYYIYADKFIIGKDITPKDLPFIIILKYNDSYYQIENTGECKSCRKINFFHSRNYSTSNNIDCNNNGNYIEYQDVVNYFGSNTNKLVRKKEK